MSHFAAHPLSPCRSVVFGFFSLCIMVLGTSPTHGEVVVSNLTETSVGTISFTPTQSVAGAFTTGDSAFTLEKITLALGNASGASSVFTVSLYSSSLGLPGALIETLSGPASPQPAGSYGFSSGGSAILNANTTYFWVGTLTSSTASDRRRSHLTASTNESSSLGWTMANAYYTKLGSGNWTASTSYSLMFSVDAVSVVPEPGAYAVLAGVAALGLVATRRRPRGGVVRIMPLVNLTWPTFHSRPYIQSTSHLWHDSR